MIWRLLKRMRLWIMNLYIKDLRILITLIFTLIFENKIELKKKKLFLANLILIISHVKMHEIFFMT